MFDEMDVAGEPVLGDFPNVVENEMNVDRTSFDGHRVRKDFHPVDQPHCDVRVFQ